MGDDELVKSAEREVVAAAEEWDREQGKSQRLLSTASQKLRSAVYMLKRARIVTGKIRVEDVQRELEASKKKP